MILENALKIELGSSFFMNAGICGLLTFLECNHAFEGLDYEIEDQCIYVSIDYLKNNDISKMYVNTIANELGKNTKFYRILHDDKLFIDNLYRNDIENLSKDTLKKLKDKYKAFCDMMLKKTYLSAYTLMKGIDNIEPIDRQMIVDLKKCDDLLQKYDKYNKIINLLQQPTVNNMLIYTELIYTQLKLFFAENAQSKQITCLYKTGQNYWDTHKDNFITPLFNELEVEDKKKTVCCIECRNMISSKGKRAFTFLADTADDLTRKKSYYWFCHPDAYVCPTCAFVFSFIPLGFALMGSEAVFINNNSSVRALKKVMNTCKVKINNEKSIRRQILRTLTTEKIDALDNLMSNIQVVMNSSDFSHFKFEVIDKNMVMKLQKGKNYLSYLENKWFSSDKKNFVSVYDLTLDYIYEKRNLYFLLDKLLKYELREDGKFNYLKGLLRLAVIFNGGANMDELNKKVDFAFWAGMDLREKILGKDLNNAGNEGDNKLRSFVYRLVNLSAVGDREQFMDTVLRIYSGFSLSMPSIFKDCYISDEMFKAIAHGFIIGLKYVPHKKENENKEDINNG